MRSGEVPVTFQFNFEAALSEWQVAVIGDDAIAVIDVFRDIAIRVPNDRQHRSLEVLRTSATATLQHWLGYLRSGPPHLQGRLLYGNDEVFRRFHDAVVSRTQPAAIGPDDALDVLRTQHWIVQAAS
jgi:hypothetical protein